MRIPELGWPVVDPPPAYDDDLLLEVTAGKVALLIRGRNAWHSTWVRHYLRDATLFTDVWSAQYAAEDRRGPGNVFYVIEAPALQLRGATSNVVVCDAHPDDPFDKFTGIGPVLTENRYGRYAKGVYPGVSVREAVETFYNDSGLWEDPTPNEHSLRTGRLPSKLRLLDLEDDLAQYRSVPQGSRYRLGWSPQASRYRTSGTLFQVELWQEQVSELGEGRRPTPTRMKRYRDKVLGAIPHALWLKQQSETMALEAKRRDDAWAAYEDAQDALREVNKQLWTAQGELHRATQDRLRPAGTSAGMRKQRERLERARSQVREIQEQVARARTHKDEAFAEWWATR